MTRRVAFWAVVTGLAVSLVAGGWLAPGAGARNQGDLGTLSPNNPLVEREFTPIPLFYPFEGRHLFAYFRPPTCRESAYCDAMEFDVEIPPGFREIHAVKITLSWPNPRSESGTTGNQLTMHLWGDDGPAFGGSTGPCETPRDPKCVGGMEEEEEFDPQHPLSITLIDPQPKEKVFITIVNSGGVNLGYTLRVEFFTFELPPLPEFDEGTLGFSGSSSGRPPGVGTLAPAPGFVAPEGSADVGDEGAERTVIVPGPDGAPMSITLPVVTAATRRVDSVQERSGVNALVTALVVLGVVAAGLGLLTVRRRRRLGEV